MTSIVSDSTPPVLYGGTRPPRRSRLAEQGGPMVNPTGGGPIPQAQPQSGYAAMTPINPAADLRSQQITPGADPRLSRAGQQADTAASGLASFRGYTPFQGVSPYGSPYTSAADRQLAGAESAVSGATGAGVRRYAGAFDPNAVPGGVSYGADTTGVRSQLANQLKSLQGPDRSALASQAYDLLTERSQPAYQQELRGVGQKAAALGRIGAGMTTNDLGTVQQRREEQLAQQRKDLALQAAGETLNDRLNVSGALQGGFGTLAGEDRSAAGLGLDAAGLRGNLAGRGADLEMGLADLGLRRGGALSNLSEQTYGRGAALRGEERGERGERRGFEQDDLGARRGIFGDLSGREDQLYGQGRGYRDELRGERGFQVDQSQQGIDNAVRQRLLEDQLLGSEFGRSMDTADLYGKLGYGYAGDPTGIMGDQADRYQGEADTAFGGVGDLLQEYLLQQQGQRPPTVTPRPPSAPRPFAQQPIDWSQTR